MTDLHSTTDAVAWAREFVRQNGGDEEMMVGWFANAIETARDVERSRLHQLLTHARAEMGEAIDWEYRHRADYPDVMRRYERDMALCYEIDKALGD